MTQKERMLAGQLYLVDEELAAEMRHTVGVLRQFNSEPEPEARAALLRGLLGGTGRTFRIEPPFRCDYGSHIYLGENFYANYELIVLDQCDVRFGDNVMLGPRVSLFSAGHPLDADIRNARAGVRQAHHRRQQRLDGRLRDRERRRDHRRQCRHRLRLRRDARHPVQRHCGRESLPRAAPADGRRPRPLAAGGRALARGMRPVRLPVSARLDCCAGLVPQGARAADIGADHGYLGISLLLNGRAEFVHASELREQPLRRAMENALRFGVADRMRFSRADGLDAIDPNEVDTIVCAGMGGDLIAQILDRCRWVRDPRYTLILQPQSSGNDLRRKLARMGFAIEQERLVRDGGFLYQAMAARFGNAAPVTPGQEYVSAALLRSGDPLLPDYFDRLIPSLERTVECLRRGSEPEPPALL